MPAGTSLEDILKHGPLPRQKALLYGARIARALEREHRQQRIHGDLRPANILISRDDTVRLVNPRIPPEDGPFRFQPGARPDIIAFGLVLYEMLTGHPVSEDEGAGRGPWWYVRDVPGEPGVLIQDCLAFPDSHFTDIGAVAAALENMLPKPRSLVVPATLALAGLALAIGTISTYLTFRGEKASPLDPPDIIVNPPPPPPAGQELEQLFSAAWLTGFDAFPDAVDVAEKAAPFLRAGDAYFLKFALRDRAFPKPPGLETAASAERISTAPPQALKPGIELDVDYFSSDLDPPQASARIRVPAPGEPSIVAFRVVPASMAHEGIRILLRLRLKDLPFYEATLKPAVYGREETTPKGIKPAWSVAEYHVDTNTAEDYQELKPGDVRITITPVDRLDRSQYGIQITWLGHRVVNGLVGVKGTELKEKMKLVREDLESISRDSVFKDALNDEDVKVDRVRELLLLKLARIGHGLYEDLFTDDRIRQVLSEIKDYSKSHEPLRVQVWHSADINDPNHPARMILPLGLLYDDPAFDPDDPGKSTVNKSHFWDYRYLLEVVEPSMLWHKNVLCRNGVVRLAAAMDVGTANSATGKDWKTQVDEQKAFLDSAQNSFQTDWVPDEDSFRELFNKQAGPDYDIIYYYGHTANGSRPSFSLTSGNTLGLDQLKRDIAKNHVTTLREYPLVILNSCRGAAFDGDNYNSFLDVMASVQAAAFIGTEASIGIPFGARMGQRLLDRFGSKKSGKTIVRALWELKREALDRKNGNPLVLLYSLFGDPFVRACPM